MWARVASTLAGLWLMFAPAVLGYGGALAVSDRIAGPVAASFAIVAMAEVVRPLRLANVPIGLWVMAAPLVLGAGLPGILNGLLAGALLAGTSLPAGRRRHRYGGGWRAAWPVAR